MSPAKEERRKLNLERINRSPYQFEERSDGTVWRFRHPGKLEVDFYPTANRWLSGGRIYHGNAHEFCRWYDKR